MKQLVKTSNYLPETKNCCRGSCFNQLKMFFLRIEIKKKKSEECVLLRGTAQAFLLEHECVQGEAHRSRDGEPVDKEVRKRIVEAFKQEGSLT